MRMQESHYKHHPFTLFKTRQTSSTAIGEIIKVKRGGRGAGEGEDRGGPDKKRQTAGCSLHPPLCNIISAAQKNDIQHREHSGYSPT